MKNTIYVIALLLWSGVAILPTRGQGFVETADLPYICDFEDASQMPQWVLNPDPFNSLIGRDNRWVIGSAEAYSGEQSMYISSDNGETRKYEGEKCMIIAYCNVKLDRGLYDVAYDWYGYGNKNHGYLKVIFQGVGNDLYCSNTVQDPPSWWGDNPVQLMEGKTMLTDGDTALGWQHVRATFRVKNLMDNNELTKIIFLWVNDETILKPVNTGIAIDNVQIAKTSPSNKYPANIHVEVRSNTVSVAWDSCAQSYEILYRKKGTREYTSVTSSTNSVLLENVDYGAYEFWIRGVNDGVRTVYTIFPTVMLYETNCFDAFNWYGATFETGNWNATTGKTNQAYEKVDFGYLSEKSRHTIHFDTTQYDPLTVQKDRKGDTICALKTVPDGKIASIRVGNWSTGSQYESVTFDYTVESSANEVLLINYALVLEDINHPETQQPRFTLDILDEQGSSINKTCGYVDFHTPTDYDKKDAELMASWHSPGGGSTAYWKDWQTIGINLNAYRGQTLTIPLTAYDCDQSGHYGYAYFTIQCARSDVDGLAWGKGNTTDRLTAPNGFKYAWFNRKDTVLKRDTLSTERELHIEGNDTNTYICYATYLTQPTCGFTFEASAKSYTPAAELDIQWAPRNCENGVVIYNKCHVCLVNQLTGAKEHRYDKQLDECTLVYSSKNGLKDSITIDYPEEGFYLPIDNIGDSLHFKVIGGTWYNGIWYGETKEYDFIVPEVKPDSLIIDTAVCAGSSVEFPSGSHLLRTETGVYYDSLVSRVTGCDSVIILDLTVHQARDTTIEDIFCIGETYDFNGKVITTQGTYASVLESKVTHCDSVITLHLKQIETPLFSIDSGNVCTEHILPIYTQNAEVADSIHITVGNIIDTVIYALTEAGTIEFMPYRLVGAKDYVAHFTTYIGLCGTFEAEIPFSTNLPSTVVFTRFEDVLALYNEKYNGGYKYRSYQWYANGMPIPGADYSWYYEPYLDQTAEYQVFVVLEDGREFWVCPFFFDDRRLVPKEASENESENRELPKKMLHKGQFYILDNETMYNLLGDKIK